MLRRASSRLADHADAVRIIDDEAGIVFFLKADQVRDRRDVPVLPEQPYPNADK